MDFRICDEVEMFGNNPVIFTKALRGD